MAIVQVSAETIGSLSGGVAAELINRAIAMAVDDLLDRGTEDGKPRKVAIVLSFEMDEAEAVDVRCSVATKVPPHVTGRCLAGQRTRQGQLSLVFDADPPRQGTLPMGGAAQETPEPREAKPKRGGKDGGKDDDESGDGEEG